MLRGFCSKQPSALGLPIEHPPQPCDCEQAGLEGQYAQTHNVTVTRLDHYLFFHYLQEQQMLGRGGGGGSKPAHIQWFASHTGVFCKTLDSHYLLFGALPLTDSMATQCSSAEDEGKKGGGEEEEKKEDTTLLRHIRTLEKSSMAIAPLPDRNRSFF